MELKVIATVSEREERAMSNALAELRAEGAADYPGLDIISSVRVNPKYEQELDGDFADETFQIYHISITVPAALAKDLVLEVVQQAVGKIVDVAHGDHRLVISLHVPGGEYTITRREERLALQARLEADATPEQQAKIETHIRKIENLLSDRYPG